MARKKPSSRDQKALTILDANLTPVQEKEDSLIADVRWDLHLAAEMIRFIERGDPQREDHFASLKEYVADANIGMRILQRLRKEVS
tara:strand:- start:1160 stop:1417 length:258 start_codon:yes stop_codon:yes gene_type:complete